MSEGKIRLLIDVFVDKEHGMQKGKILSVIEDIKGYARSAKAVWVRGDTGKRVKLWDFEFEWIENKK